MLYESMHSVRTDLWKIEKKRDLSFPPHLHGCFEVVTLTEGEMFITVDGVRNPLRAGDAILIFPNQVHSFDTPVHSAHTLCIFSPNLVQAYASSVRDKLPRSNLFSLDPFYAERITTLTSASEIEIKGLLYSICAEFDRTATYGERREDKEDLLVQIFRFVEENYDKDCSLERLCAHTSYHYSYLSRYFKQCTTLSYTDYVNHYRIGEAQYLLKNTQKAILQIAFECGFDSLRTFNRNFKAITGLTPAVYRDGEKNAEA